MELKFIKTNEKEIPQLKEYKGRDYIKWGEDNLIPYYLYNLYTKSSLMTSIVGSMVDYICGDSIVGGEQRANRKGDSYDTVISNVAFDYALYGGFALQVIRNRNNEVAEINWIDMRFVRTDEEEGTVWVADWANRKRPVKYERLNLDAKQPNAVYVYKGHNSRGVYPVPMYVGSIVSLEIQAEISNFHLNNILNGFNPNVIVNFNQGQNLGEDEVEKVEEKVYEKFCGTDNAGKVLLSFNDDYEHRTTFERMEDDNLDKKYDQLYSTTVNDIYSGFRMNPVLNGCNKTNSGFTGQEFDEAFKLYQKTVIQPIQKDLERVFRTLGKDIAINPFSISFLDAEKTNNTVTE